MLLLKLRNVSESLRMSFSSALSDSFGNSLSRVPAHLDHAGDRSVRTVPAIRNPSAVDQPKQSMELVWKGEPY